MTEFPQVTRVQPELQKVISGVKDIPALVSTYLPSFVTTHLPLKASWSPADSPTDFIYSKIVTAPSVCSGHLILLTDLTHITNYLSLDCECLTRAWHRHSVNLKLAASEEMNWMNAPLLTAWLYNLTKSLFCILLFTLKLLTLNNILFSDL